MANGIATHPPRTPCPRLHEQGFTCNRSAHGFQHDGRTQPQRHWLRFRMEYLHRNGRHRPQELRIAAGHDVKHQRAGVFRPMPAPRGDLFGARCCDTTIGDRNFSEAIIDSDRDDGSSAFIHETAATPPGGTDGLRRSPRQLREQVPQCQRQRRLALSVNPHDRLASADAAILFVEQESIEAVRHDHFQRQLRILPLRQQRVAGIATEDRCRLPMRSSHSRLLRPVRAQHAHTLLALAQLEANALPVFSNDHVPIPRWRSRAMVAKR